MKELSKLRVAAVQFRASRDKSENLKKVLSYIDEASKNAELIVFPECVMCYPLPREGFTEIAEPLDGEFIKSLLNAAKEHHVNIVFNTWETCREVASKVYDTSIFISSNGEIKSIYRKTHLFDAFKFRESYFIKPGDEFAGPVALSGFNVGMLICYDVRFPETARILAVKGCNVICVSAAWYSGLLKEEHWLTMIRARAIENGVYIIAANQSGPTFCGRSVIIDPFGVILADAGDMEKVIYGELEFERLKNVREMLPLIDQRRPNLYRDLTIQF